MYSRTLLTFLIIWTPFALSFKFFQSGKIRDHVVIADEISAGVANRLCKRHNMNLVGEGGGMMGSVYMIGLHFEIHQSLSREEARAKIIDCVEELLTAVNSNEEIRPYLKNYPFTTKNLQIAIHITGPNWQPIYDPEICVVSVFESDYIQYRTEEPNSPTYKQRQQELYSDALKIVKKGVQPTSSN